MGVRDGLGRNVGLGGGLLTSDLLSRGVGLHRDGVDVGLREGAGVDFVGLREGAGADLVRRGLGVELGLLGGANPPGGVEVLGLDPGLLGAKSCGRFGVGTGPTAATPAAY